MRILLLSTYFQPDVASTGVLMSMLAEELAELGHRVTVVTSMPHYGTNRKWEQYRGKIVARERVNQLDIIRVSTLVPKNRAHSTGRLFNYASFNAFSAFAGLLSRKPDVVLTPSPPLTNGLVADFLGRLKSVPFVYNVQDIWPEGVVRAGAVTGSRAISLARRLEDFVYRRAACVTVISEGFRQNLLGKGVPADKIEVVPNFFDTDFVRPLPRNNPFSSSHDLDGRFVVLFAGNLGPSRGLEKVLEAAAILGDLEEVLFLVVGGGAAKEKLQTRAGHLGLKNVRFLPWQPHEELPDLYASSDVCLVPLSKGMSTAQVPCKVYTIMSSGRPMIASVDQGSDTWLLVEETGSGVCTQPEDAEALAEAIRLLYKSSEGRAAMGERGRAHVEKHNTRRAVALKYEEILAGCAGRG